MLKTNGLSDSELIGMFMQNDTESIEILVNRYKNKVFTYIFFNVKKQHIAEDIFQDTIIKVIRSLREGKYQDNGRFLSWMMRIAHNLIIDHYRHEKQLQTISNDDQEMDLFNFSRYSESTIEQTMVREQIMRDVRKLIEELPPDQKEIILLRHYGGLSFKEIAEHTNVSINTALGRMRYALINMRKLIKEHDMNLSVI